MIDLDQPIDFDLDQPIDFDLDQPINFDLDSNPPLIIEEVNPCYLT